MDRDSSVSFEYISRILCMFDLNHSRYSWDQGLLEAVREPKEEVQNVQDTCDGHHSEVSAQSKGISSRLKRAI